MDDDERRALRELREIGDAVLTRLGHVKLIGKPLYKLERRFVAVLGSCEVYPSSDQSLIRVQYPLWNVLDQDEKLELAAHEHSHLVAWKLHGPTIQPHGEEWRDVMKFLGYRHFGSQRYLNPLAHAFLAERRKRMFNKKNDGRVTLWVKDGYIFMHSPFNREFIDEFKADIPANARSWMVNDKVWRVAASYHEDLLSVVRKHFGEPTVVEPEPQVVVQAAGGGDDPYGAMLRVAPPDLLKKIYRLIAAEIHPDKGGKPDDMVALNNAWAEVKKEKGL